MSLSLCNIQFERHYRDLFQNVTKEIHHGDCLQITGPNGSGKTTLLRIAAGLIEPHQGDVLWQQQSIFKTRENFLQNMQYIGHKNGIKPHLTVYENIEFYMALNGKKQNKNDIMAALDYLGLAKKCHDYAGSLSAGLARRLSLARLILHPVTLWILDEPLTALDRTAQRLWLHLFNEHLNRGGMIMLTTHQPLSLEKSIKTLMLEQADV